MKKKIKDCKCFDFKDCEGCPIKENGCDIITLSNFRKTFGEIFINLLKQKIKVDLEEEIEVDLDEKEN